MVGGKSVDVRPQEPAQIDPDAERVAVELEWNAAAKVKLEIQVRERLIVDPSVITVVTHEVRTARGNAGSGEALAIFRRATRTAFGGRAATEDPADHRLVSPRCDIIGRDREAEVARVIFEATFELSVIAEGEERAMKEPRVHDCIADAGVKERGEIAKGVVEMVGEIPSGVAGAEALLRGARRSRQMDGRTVVQGLVGIVQPEVREETADANTGNRTRIIFLDGRRGADKIKRHAGVHSKVTRKVV